MLIGLSIRNVVLIQALDLSVGAGLTALTGETGAGKSIVLDALGLALGARADSGLVRRGASSASATAVFSLPQGHPVFLALAEKGLEADAGGELVLRRQIAADAGRAPSSMIRPPASACCASLAPCCSRCTGSTTRSDCWTPAPIAPCWIATAVAPRRRGPAVWAWSAWRERAAAAAALRARVAKDAAEAEDLTLRLAELDRLDPKPGEETALADQRACSAQRKR